jgi:hypothetical protein
VTDPPKKIKAVVVLKADCIRDAGMESTFAVVHRTNIERLILPVVDFNLEDSSLAEFRFYPKIFEGRWMELFVPKHAILAIIRLEDSQDKSALGFKAEEMVG